MFQLKVEKLGWFKNHGVFMRRIKEVTFFAVLLATSTSLFGQGFVNLNFEQAQIVVDSSSPYFPSAVDATAAFPGWTVVPVLPPNDITLDALSLGETSISLVDKHDSFGPNSLIGNYSIDMYGGVLGPAPAGASISQTAVVPSDAASIRFIAGTQPAPPGFAAVGPLLVSLGGQNIPFTALSTTPAFTTYGGDVSAFAGQLSQLTLTVPMGNNNYWEIDDITFSSSPIPEPGTLSLFGICTLFFAWRIRANRGCLTG